MGGQTTCYTIEAALEKAIDLETSIFKQFLNSLRIVKHLGAREILKDAASEELRHKQYLEQSLLEGELGAVNLDKTVPTMDLDHRIGVDVLQPDADSRAALAYAIHMINTSVQFYTVMTEACNGAPMSTIFKQIGNEQRQHLQKLEDSYEEHFLSEN
jgi:rubrerythrin